MCNDRTFKQKEQRLKEYEMVSNRNLQQDDTELGYRDMNTRFLNAEIEHLSSKENVDINKVREDHIRKKNAIESAWHKNSAASVMNLKKRAPKKGSEKEARYYSGYGLKDLEVFLKNSDRGGNSDEYNAVATDLELYNRIMDSSDAVEGMGLLKRLKESCDHYLSTRKNPVTSKGKIRKAIITSLSEKVNVELVRQREEYQNAHKNNFAAMKDENTSENVTAAFKSNYNMIFQVLNGNIELSDEERMKLDSDSEEILSELIKLEVDQNQSKALCTKFFNALGWSKNDPRIVDYEEFAGKEMKNSPHKKLCYHSIAPLDKLDENGKVIGKEKDAIPQAKQLAGFAKEGKGVYYGIGRIGKGVYTAARDNNPDAKDAEAKHNSWRYGRKKGSVMFTMLLNEHARITTESDMINISATIRKTFPKLYNYIATHESGKFLDYLTMIAAYMGYNTIIGAGADHVEYITTSNRKALTMLDNIEVRTNENDEYLTDELSLTELKKQEMQKADA